MAAVYIVCGCCFNTLIYMILEKLQRLQEPCCGIVDGVLGLIGTGISSAINAQNVEKTNELNRQIAQETNQTNKDIADATNETNLTIAREANAAAKEEAELAYQRSTASAKIDELVAAGISPQQAKMIVAGQGATGTYTAAPQQVATAVAPTMQTGAPMQAAQVGDFRSAAAELGSGIGDLVDKAYNSSNGGTIGLLRANDAIEFLNTHVNDVPVESLSSFHAFKTWLDKLPADTAFGKFRDTDAWRKVCTSTPAQRAYMYNLNQSYADNADTHNRLELADLQMQQQRIQNAISQVEELIKWKDLDIANAELNRQLLQQDIDIELHDQIKDAQRQELYYQITYYKLQSQALNDPQYREAYCATLLANQLGALYAAQYYQFQQGVIAESIKNDPAFAQNVAIFDYLTSIGFDQTIVGSRFMECMAAGMSVSEFLQKELPAIQQVQQGFKSLYDGDVATGYYDAIEGMTKEQFSALFSTTMKEKGIEFGIDAVNTVVDFFFNLMASKKGRQFRNGGGQFAPFNPYSPYNPSRSPAPLPM